MSRSGVAYRSGLPNGTGLRVYKVDRFVVPLGEATSAAFLLDHLYVAHNLRERLAWPIHRATGGCALFEVAHASDLTVASRAAIAEALRRSPARQGRRRSWIVDTDYPDRPRGRSLVFVFADGAHPALIIKRAPVSDNSALPSLRRERDTLAALRQRLPGQLAPTVPEVLAHDVENGWESLALAVLPGRSAYAEMQTRIVPAAAVGTHFESASRWLARFHDATRNPKHAFAPAGLANPVHNLAASSQAPHDEWLMKLCEFCERRPVQAVTSHGDYWPRNVLFVRRGATAEIGGVVDWENSCDAASPFDDLFQFALTYGLNYPWSWYQRANPLSAFRRTFLEENHVSRAVRRYLRSYCRERGLDASHLVFWFRWFLRMRAARDASNGALWIRLDAMIGAAGRSVFSG